jgi:aspartate aminotransferase
VTDFPRISKRIGSIAESATLKVDAKAKSLQAAGRPVISYAAGEPDFATPAHIVEAAAIAVRDPKNHRYTPAIGLPDLREAIAHKTRIDSGTEISAAQVVVTNGGKQAVYQAFATLVDPGDEVLMPTPFWTTYPEAIRLAGGVPVEVFAGADQNYQVTVEQLEAARTPRSKVLLFVSPSNPTGSVYTREELKALAEVAAEEDIFILSDEIYEKLTYDGAEHISMASITPEAYDLTITVNGFSKAYSMTGWRLGYLAAPEPIARVIDSMQSHMTSNACSFAQYGGLAALTGDQQCVIDMREEFDVRRQYMFERLTQIPGITAVRPQGAFYVLANIGALGLNSQNFADRLLSKANVALVPGIAFGADNTVRLSYATSLDVIKSGIDRIEEFCKTL